jgi:hypothetical protein
VASKQSRAIATRRDRRKAKASNFARQPKRQMGRVAHGTSGPEAVVLVPKSESTRKRRPKDEPVLPVTTSPLIPHDHPLRADARPTDANERESNG